jgi:hypothetical protein
MHFVKVLIVKRVELTLLAYHAQQIFILLIFLLYTQDLSLPSHPRIVNHQNFCIWYERNNLVPDKTLTQDPVILEASVLQSHANSMEIFMIADDGSLWHLSLFVFTQPLLGCYQWRNCQKRDVTALSVMRSKQDQRADLFFSSSAVDLGCSQCGKKLRV